MLPSSSPRELWVQWPLLSLEERDELAIDNKELLSRFWEPWVLYHLT